MADDLIGKRFGQYEILSLLGAGGMATVYRVRQTNIKRDVAMKVIRANLSKQAELTRRFEREAETIAGLDHPHILKLFDFGEQDGLLYLVTELKTGGSLVDLIHRSPLPAQHAAKLLDQIASALDYAHAKGIIHRDLKPHNVLLDEPGNAVLTDFGIAKLLQGEFTVLTQSGAAIGTPSYMAPEQWEGASLDARTDVYALGVMLFEMLTGRLPFQADTPVSMMYKHMHESPPSARDLQPGLPSAVDAVIQRALAKDLDGRFNSAGVMAAAFQAAIIQYGGEETILTDKDAPATAIAAERADSTEVSTDPRRGSLAWAAIVAVLVLLIIGGVVLMLPRGTPSTPLAVVGGATATITPTLSIEEIANTQAAQEAAAARAVGAASVATFKAERTTIAGTVTLWTRTPTAILTVTSTLTRTFTATTTPTAIPPITANEQWKPVGQRFDGVEMVLVPPGCFMMGSDSGDDNERPAHRQCFDKPFWIDRYEVTSSQFTRLNPGAELRSYWREPNRPLDSQVWFQARDFCARRGGRLPTEAEWEYAARGPSNLVYPWGNDLIIDSLIFSANSNNQTAEVGSKVMGMSWVGAFDMSGNVWEWVNTLYKSYPYIATDGREDAKDATNLRVLRGGAWGSRPIEVRTAYRRSRDPYEAGSEDGFRCVRGPIQSIPISPSTPTMRPSKTPTDVPVLTQKPTTTATPTLRVAETANTQAALSPSATRTIVAIASTVTRTPTATISVSSTAEIANTQAAQEAAAWQSLGVAGAATFKAVRTMTAAAATRTPTPNVNASAIALRTERVATNIAQRHDNQTATATRTTPTAIPAITANKQWKALVQKFDGVEMVLVPAGCFTMGSDNSDGYEKPAHRQCFDKSFWIDKYEVTQGQFKQLGGQAARLPDFRGDSRPVEHINWVEAQSFCAKRGARLPTEREWEYAARGPDNLVYPWGNSFESDNVVFGGNTSGQTAEVGSKPKGISWVGAYDLSGNVSEWISSMYQPYPYSETDGREVKDDARPNRVLRGGSWSHPAAELRLTNRDQQGPWNSDFNYIGFRCARNS